MDLEILLAVEVLECSFGMFGFLIGDLQDCYWKKYYLEDPIAGIHWLSALDTQTVLLDWWLIINSRMNTETKFTSVNL